MSDSGSKEANRSPILNKKVDLENVVADFSALWKPMTMKLHTVPTKMRSRKAMHYEGYRHCEPNAARKHNKDRFRDRNLGNLRPAAQPSAKFLEPLL
jgi:hypothetical protein